MECYQAGKCERAQCHEEKHWAFSGTRRARRRRRYPQKGQVCCDRAGGDQGEPIVSATGDGDSASADALREVAGRLAQRLAVKAFASLPILD